MSQHAVLSASGSDRWQPCPKSPAMERGLPDTSSQYADEGTAAHLLGSTCLEEGTNPGDYHGRRILVGPADGPNGAQWDGAVWADSPDASVRVRREYVVDDEMVAGITTYVENVRKIADGELVFVEQRVPLDQITGEEGAEGTADAVIFLDDDEIVVNDLKYGRDPVSAEDNKQLLAYASGAVEKFDITHGPFNRVRLVIHQPRVSVKPSEWDCSIEYLQKYVEETRPKAALALAFYRCADAVQAGAARMYAYLTGQAPRPEDADNLMEQFGPDPRACKYCKAKAHCPAALAAAQEAIGADFTADPPEEVKLPEDHGSLARVLSWSSYVEKYFKAIRARAEALMFEHKNSEEIQQALGLKIVMGKAGNREWSNEEEVEAYAKTARLKTDITHTKKLKSPTQLEKLLKKTHARKWSKFEELITRKDGVPSVASIDDPRDPWIPPDPAEDFTAEEPAKIF